MKTVGKKLHRRIVLRGLAGATLGLPFLEAFSSSKARAAVTDPFMILVGCGNGVQAALSSEPERWWPRTVGALDVANMNERAVDELVEYRDRLLIVRGVNRAFPERGDHGFGGACLTAQDAVSDGNNRLAGGESIDWRIGRELNPPGRDPLNLYAGYNSNYIGANLSYRGSGDRRSPEMNPLNAYQNVVGIVGNGQDTARELLVNRRKSINDMVRPQLERLMRSSSLSQSDRARVDQHLQQVRDLELDIVRQLTTDEERELQDATGYYNDMPRTPEIAVLHEKIAALAVVAGATRAAVIQVGAGQDGTSYRVDGQLQESFHFISHRARSDSDTAVGGAGGFPESEMLHHRIDRIHLQTFKVLIDRLVEYGALDDGVAIWTNNLANGPYHGMQNLPFVLAGSCGGVFRQGQYVNAGGVINNRMLNTIGSAVGLRRGSGPLDNFGHPSLPGGLISEMLANEPWA